MPKRIKDKNKSIFVKFEEGVTGKEVHALFNELGVTGTRVSIFVNRWAIEVPFWKEDFYMSKFADNDLVETVHENFDKKRKNPRREENEEGDIDEQNG